MVLFRDVIIYCSDQGLVDDDEFILLNEKKKTAFPYEECGRFNLKGIDDKLKAEFRLAKTDIPLLS